eukprot:128974-Pelagomonas_calceolata.AAC.1
MTDAIPLTSWREPQFMASCVATDGGHEFGIKPRTDTTEEAVQAACRAANHGCKLCLNLCA